MASADALAPTEFRHGPRWIPHLRHVCNPVVLAHGQDIHIVGMGLPMGWRHRTSLSRMFAMVGRKKQQFCAARRDSMCAFQIVAPGIAVPAAALSQ